jgi:hypothetical protein
MLGTWGTHRSWVNSFQIRSAGPPATRNNALKAINVVFVFRFLNIPSYLALPSIGSKHDFNLHAIFMRFLVEVQERLSKHFPIIILGNSYA